jgi:hypothetical protein
VDSLDGLRPPSLPTGPSTAEGRSIFIILDTIVPVSPRTNGCPEKPGAAQRALVRIARAMVALYCASFRQVPRRITLDIDDTFDAVHGGQQLRLFNAFYDEYGFQPIVVFDGDGRPVAAMLRPAGARLAPRRAPSCAAWCARSAAIGRASRS